MFVICLLASRLRLGCVRLSSTLCIHFTGTFLFLGCFLATPSLVDSVISSVLASPPPLPLLPLVFLCPFPLSLFSLFPPPLYVSSCIPQLKLCRCLCGDFCLSHIPSASFRNLSFFLKAAFVKKK